MVYNQEVWKPFRHPFDIQTGLKLVSNKRSDIYETIKMHKKVSNTFF